MSWEAKDWAERKGRDYQLDPTTRWVFSVLGGYADKQGKNIFPALSTLEDATGLSERTIRRSLKKLMAVGLLHYGDQSVVSNNPRYRNDQLPKVYDFTIAQDSAGQLDFSNFGRIPQPKKKRPWQRKPKPPAPAPVDKSPEDRPEDPGRPDSLSRTPGQTPRHNVHQTDKPLNEPLRPAAAAVPASPEVIDYAAVLELRQASRARLAARGIHITDPLPCHA